MTLTEIRCYPVKGLNGGSLEEVVLTAGEGLPHDRRFALAHASSQFDRTAPGWLPKQNFLTLMRDERLAQLDTIFDAETGLLTVLRNGRQVARGDITQPLGRTLIEQFLDAFLPAGPRGNARIVNAPGAMLTDNPDKLISIINLASVTDIERVARAQVDPRRFRSNIHIDGAGAWSELSWIGRTLAIGDTRLEVIEAINRCAATEVNPDTGARDLRLPLILRQGFGHILCGVYAKVRTGGRVRVGDTVSLPGD